MRIQHNILSMNAYRNYTNNTSALGKNLEKLSSGYKINRAGDDAAGLAISEKMRAQIKGLDAAQKNVKDSISFVKTAEGAMQEIQDMLSRMKYLATQSANGTYQDDVDREALQDEVDSLLEEIDRIAQSANFNDVHMLNGPTAGGGAGGDDNALTAADITAPTAPTATFTDGDGTNAAKTEFDFDGVAFAKAGTVTVSFGGKDYDVAVTEDTDADAFAAAFVTAYNADKLADTGTNNAGAFTAAVDGTTASKVIFTAANATATVVDTALKTELAKAPTIAPKAGTTGQADAADAPKPPTFTENTTGKKLADFELAGIDLTGVELAAEGDVEVAYDTNGIMSISVGGKTYKSADISTATAGDEITLTEDGGTATIKATLANTITNIAGKTAMTKAAVGKAAPAADDGGDNAGGAATGNFTIKFQIGDTSDGYNQLNISIQSMSTASIGVSGLKGVGIATDTAASASIQTIKDAINTVSSVRGQLGAWQNRLEHTANNLSVMHENIQDAESTIRDTDVADEMMAYTKNNILIQSAQAMLAQANAVPQGVLQLLQ